MTLSLERKIGLGFGAAIAVLLLVMSAAWWNVTRFTGTQFWVNHTRVVLNDLEQARGLMLEMQASSRGFVLTGSPGVLAPYDAASARLEHTLATLDRLLVDHAAQHRRLRELQPLVQRAQALMLARIEDRRARGFDAVTEAQAYVEGQRAVDAVGAAIRELASVERALLDDRLDRARRVGRITAFAIGGATLVGVGLLALATVTVRRELHGRREAEDQRDRFFTLSRDLLAIASFEGRYQRVNPAWEAVLGHPAAELLARPFIEFVHPDDRERTLAETARLAAGKESVDFENRYRCRDGSYRWLQWSARPAAKDRLIYASARDVTERKETEQRIQSLHADLAHRAEQLEAANRELESFSYSVSHDLRAPLRHIDGFASLLAKRIETNPDVDAQRFLTIISRAAKQMGTLIDDLLAFSRIGRTLLRVEPVQHDRLLADVITDGHYRSEHPNIAWDIRPLPDVRADAALLRLVWTNLIDNAVKYSRKAAQPRITIGAEPGGTRAGEHVFFVRDNGVGFDMAYADKLFGVFQRLHGPTEFEGTGIGLANVRRIVARHGGQTWAEGRIGEGATFYFSLPITVILPRPHP